MKTKSKKQKGRRILAVLAFLLAVFLTWVIWSNYAPVSTRYKFTSDRLPKEFSGFTLVQISDLHNASFGNENEKLLELIRDAEPDMIVITGDMIDSYRTHTDVALRFAEDALEIAPCCYVPGNHESRIETYPAFRESLTALGVTVLEDETVTLRYDDAFITLIGVADPSFSEQADCKSDADIMTSKLAALSDKNDGFTLLLSHRPELFEVYASKGIDLALCGHAHGGQIRLPFVGGVIAPNQGFFPKFDAGEFTENGCTMIVSRGIGSSVLRLRVNNRPEVVIIELASE